MGLCNSTRVSSATAKLILPDGTLQEYPYPVRASCVLQKNPAVFICNSDEMEFHGVVCAVADDGVLQPGQLYFALPLSRLRHPIQPEEMAALAVKASSALINSIDKGGVNRNVVSPEISRGEPRRGRSKREKFRAMLSAIPE